MTPAVLNLRRTALDIKKRKYKADSGNGQKPKPARGVIHAASPAAARREHGLSDIPEKRA